MSDLHPRVERTVRELAERMARVERAQRRDSRTQPTRRSPVTADAATGQPPLSGEVSAPVVLGVPAAPTVDAVGELLAVHLTGLDAQGERAPAGVVARVHTSLQEGFTVSEGTVAQSVHPTGTVPVAVLTAGVWHVRVEWVLGGQSTVSDAVTVDVEPLVDTADLEQALATAQERLDAVKAALGALSGPLTPMLAGVLPDVEGQVYYQKDETGEIVSAWQVVNGAWVQQPLESAVLVRVTTDQLVAGMGLIGGVLIEDGAVTANHITASESLTAKLAQFLKVKAGQIEANAFEGQTFTGGTFTGAITQSDPEPSKGVKTSTTGIQAWAPDGTKTFDVNAATGQVTTNGLDASGGTVQGATVVGGYIGTSNMGQRVFLQGDSLTAKDAAENTTAYLGPDGIQVLDDSGTLRRLGPHIFGAQAHRWGANKVINNNHPAGSTAWSAENVWTAVGTFHALSSRYRADVSFMYRCEPDWAANAYYDLEWWFQFRIGTRVFHNLMTRRMVLANVPPRADLSFSAHEISAMPPVRPGENMTVRFMARIRGFSQAILTDLNTSFTPV